MAKKKTLYYYVLVFTSNGPKFVTSLPERNTAKWEDTAKPFSVSEDFAHDIVKGLIWNGHPACVVTSQWEVEQQPYNYEFGYFEWHNKDIEPIQ